MPKTVVGVDIAGAAIRGVEVADADRGRPTVARFAEVALPEGAVSRGEVLEPNTVAQALKRLWAEGRFKTKDVVLGMGNQRVLSRELVVPRAPRHRIRESLPFQVQDMLPVPVQDALLDFYPIAEEQGEQGPMIRGLLIAAVKDAVLSNVRAAGLAGLTVVGVDLIPFALSRVLVGRPGLAGTVALIDVGANTTTMVILTDGVPQFVRIIPSAGDDLTSALVARLELSPEEAETIKRTLGLAQSVSSHEEQRAVAVVYEIANELLSSLRNTINFFVNTHPDKPVSTLVLTGGGADLPGLADALGDYTRIPVVVGDPFAAVGVTKAARAADIRARRSALTVAVGLAVGRRAA